MSPRESYYRINVVKVTETHKTSGGHVHCGKHFFAVDVCGKQQAQKVYEDLKERYPHNHEQNHDNCFTVDVTYWDITGRELCW